MKQVKKLCPQSGQASAIFEILAKPEFIHEIYSASINFLWLLPQTL